MIDFVYIVDLVLMFFTSVIDKQGKETFNSHIIAARVITTPSVYIDALSLIGTDFHNGSTRHNLKYFALLKTYRLFRIGGIISSLNVVKSIKDIMQLIKLIFYLCFYLWALTCGLWWTITKNAPKLFYIL